MRTWTMRSPEGVELELPIATPAPRMAAYAIDLMAVGLLVLTLFVLLALGTPAADWIVEQTDRWSESTGRGDTGEAMAALLPVMIVVMLVSYFGEVLYFGLWETATRGLTPGKYIVRLRVVGLDGQLTAKAVWVRNLLRVADMLPSGYAVGLIAMLVSDHGQRLGDHAAGTLVIRTDRVEQPPKIELPPALEPLPLSREQLERLGPQELHLARATLRRNQGAAADPELLDDVARSLAKRLGLDADELHDPLRLLQRIVLTGERRGRT
jgi:uncharacterized RDD family membrane protein YckC